MKFLLRVIAVPVLILFVVALPLSLGLRNIGALVFEASTTKALVRESLMDSTLAGRLARRGAQQLLTSQQGGEASLNASADLFSQLSEEDWRQITEIIAPESLVSDTVDEVIDSFTVWLNDADAEFPSLNVDLSAWKVHATDKADELLIVFLAALPECSQEEAGNLAQQALVMQVESLPACRPGEPQYSQMISQARPLMQRMLERTPDTINLDQITQGADAPSELIELKASLIQVRFWLAWGWLAVVAIGLLAAGLGATGLRSFLIWVGWPLLAAAVICLLLGLSMFIFNYQFLEQVFALANDTPAASVLAASVAGGVLQSVGGPLMLQGLVMMAVAMVALWYARSLQHQERSPGIPINRKRIRL